MNPTDEAAVILTRILESLARASGKTLKPSTRSDITRLCELLASAGQEYVQLDDLAPRAEVPEEVKRWRAERDRR